MTHLPQLFHFLIQHCQWNELPEDMLYHHHINKVIQCIKRCYPVDEISHSGIRKTSLDVHLSSPSCEKKELEMKPSRDISIEINNRMSIQSL